LHDGLRSSTKATISASVVRIVLALGNRSLRCSISSIPGVGLRAAYSFSFWHHLEQVADVATQGFCNLLQRIDRGVLCRTFQPRECGAAYPQLPREGVLSKIAAPGFQVLSKYFSK
jgi:hypothetical protein